MAVCHRLRPTGNGERMRSGRSGRQEHRGHPVADGPEDRGVGDRCILGFNTGPPMLPGAHNQNVQIFQTPDYVVVWNELIHNSRISSLDGNLHSSLR